jgi:hypothetical protein
MRWVLVCLWLSGGLVAAQSQPTKQESGFFIIFDSLTKRCVIVERMPQTDTPSITVASDSVYKTRAEAEGAMKLVKACSE